MHFVYVNCVTCDEEDEDDTTEADEDLVHNPLVTMDVKLD